MKNYINILSLAAVMCASLVGASCSREDIPDVVAEPEYTRVELAFDMGSLQTRASSEQGDQISDVTVWAYKVTSGTGANAIVEQTPVGWGTKTFANTYTSAPLYFELPYSATEAQTFRFVAIVNKDAFGSILKPTTASGQPALTLNETTSYTNLTHAVFQADALMKDYPTNDTPAAMPVSHWQDFRINAGVTDLTGLNAKEMTVYRAVAKTQLNARLASASSTEAALRITSVTIKAASGTATGGYAIPSQGFVFSDIADLKGTGTAAVNPTPSAFGDYQDVVKAVPNISLKNTAALGDDEATFTPTAVKARQSTDATATATYNTIGSAFLYENHHTTTGTSTTSPDAYTIGTYYMEIHYDYGQAASDSSDTDGIVDATRKTATNYVPLPSVVRNRDYQVNATFEVNLAGTVQLAYEVVDWKDGGTTDLNFSYPTFTVEAAETDPQGKPVYDKPEAYYDSTDNEKGAFTFKLTITGPLNTEKKYTITHMDNGGNFDIKAYKVENNAPTNQTVVDNSTTYITASTNYHYLIKVYPTAAMPTGEGATAPTCSVGITHTASWTGTSEYLLINIGEHNGRKWPNSGDDNHLITVTQIAAPTTTP